jgi:radical SAM protein with 4Fe4S-binding SPASM domain
MIFCEYQETQNISLVMHIDIIYMVLSNESRISEYAKTGADIGHHVFMDAEIWLDKSFPELIKIEDFVVIASGVKILTHDSSICNTKGYFFQKGVVHIKRNAFIGANSIILPSITIGENSIVGAGSVVTKDVPSDTVVAGNPAKKICSTNELLLKRMLNSKHINCIWRSPYLAPEYLDIKNTKLSLTQFATFNSYINEQTDVLVFPQYIVIEPTNRCNLNCIMCPRKDMTRQQGFMDFELFKKIIDECEGHVDFIYLHFFGEPLLHPKIIDFINYAAGKAMTIALSSNATVLNERMSRDLLQSKLDLLIISIDSLNPEIYKKIRDGGNLENILKNIDTFLNLHQTFQSTLNVSLQIIEMSLNKEEDIRTFTSRWKLRDGLNLTIKPLYNYADQVQNIHNLGNFPENNSDRRVCVEPWRGLVIGWDGIVVPCCNDFNYKFTLGDVSLNTLAEIWNSDKIQEMRKCQRNGLQKSIELCKGCLINHESYLTAISHISSFNPTRKEASAYFDKGLWTPEICPEYENLWTKKYFEISVQDKFKDVTITLCNDNPRKESIGVEISLFGKVIRDERIGRITDIILQTPDQFKGRLLRYGFALEKDWIPQEVGINADTRRLGVRIEKIIN